MLSLSLRPLLVEHESLAVFALVLFLSFDPLLLFLIFLIFFLINDCFFFFLSIGNKNGLLVPHTTTDQGIILL